MNKSIQLYVLVIALMLCTQSFNSFSLFRCNVWLQLSRCENDCQAKIDDNGCWFCDCQATGSTTTNKAAVSSIIKTNTSAYSCPSQMDTVCDGTFCSQIVSRYDSKGNPCFECVCDEEKK